MKKFFVLGATVVLLGFAAVAQGHSNPCEDDHPPISVTTSSLDKISASVTEQRMIGVAAETCWAWTSSMKGNPEPFYRCVSREVAGTYESNVTGEASCIPCGYSEALVLHRRQDV